MEVYAKTCNGFKPITVFPKIKIGERVRLNAKKIELTSVRIKTIYFTILSLLTYLFYNFSAAMPENAQMKNFK